MVKYGEIKQKEPIRAQCFKSSLEVFAKVFGGVLHRQVQFQTNLDVKKKKWKSVETTNIHEN